LIFNNLIENKNKYIKAKRHVENNASIRKCPEFINILCLKGSKNAGLFFLITLLVINTGCSSFGVGDGERWGHSSILRCVPVFS
jgi:hypothetical protein